ncbi:hypothetical protein ACFQ5J_11500 [Lacticaseibacillus baoqingensis]|uniref:Uncharacterized protein n=1 Tax=Lacticaseibacillus baoqingensis TaxID=2486013 RepID=A0ABW4E9R8_9LACO|nr:hypothetical protein [Lacticaseibacillus baoqingensis]
MPQNWSLEESTYQLLKDIERHYFTTDRQVNHNSMLYTTVQTALDGELIKDVQITPIPSVGLATLALSQANLTPAGTEALTALRQQFEKDDADV